LYGEALDVLLKKWSSEKRIQRDPIYQDLSVPLEKMMLAEIASRSFHDNRLFFSKQEAIGQIEQFLKSNLNAPQSLDGERVLEAIQIQQGILVERARNVLSFSHLTLQEYLTAKYIVDYDRTQVLVKECLTDKRWREVFLLVAGLLPTGADSLLQQIEKEIGTLIHTEKLKGLAKWTNDVTSGSSGDFKPAAKRVVALFYARDRALARAKIFTSVDFQALVNQLEAMENSVPGNNAPIEERRSFVNRLRQTWYEAFHLDPEWLDLSEEEIRSLEDYLYANELMIRCKEAAVRVSPQVWEAIESRMLTVRDN
jgi:hypothetical protein